MELGQVLHVEKNFSVCVEVRQVWKLHSVEVIEGQLYGHIAENFLFSKICGT